MNTANASRSGYWDMVKGLGIIAIVLGHSCYFAVAFVYLFHLALFFFVSGYLYSEKKYGDTPFVFFGVRLAGAWPRYMFYTAIFVLVHNFFVNQGLYAGQELYNHTKMLTAICSNVSFSGAEPVQGALWFIPVWLVASGMFAGTVWFGRRFSRWFNRPGWKIGLIGLANLLIGLVGVFLNMRKSGTVYMLQTSFLVVPLYFFAYLLRIYVPEFKRYATWYGCIISAIVLYLINNRLHILIELASMSIPGLWFYVISLIGIYFILSLTVIMEKIPPVSRLLCFLGRYSFEIMAIHFAVFKLIDLVYAKFWLHAIPENLAAIPISFTHELWVFYLIGGTLIPAAIGWIVDQVIMRCFTRTSRSLSEGGS
ncbi:MAG: acyltransferase family protein [Clostridium sp.]